jgi:hypothetical protein
MATSEVIGRATSTSSLSPNLAIIARVVALALMGHNVGAHMRPIPSVFALS